MKKIRYYGQSQQSESGISCVKIMMDLYGRHISITTLRNEVNAGRDGTSIRLLQDILLKNGMDVLLKEQSYEDVLTAKEPVILYWENGQYVIFEGKKNNQVSIFAPLEGRQKIDLDEFRAKFSGYAIYTKPGLGFEKQSNLLLYWRIFLPVILADKAKYVKVAILSVLGYGLTLISPILLQHIIDNILNQVKYWEYVRYFAVFAVASTVILAVKNIALIKLRMKIDKNLTSKVVVDLLEVPYSFFDIRNSADIIFSLNGCTTLRELFANQVVRGVIDIGAVITITTYFFYKSFIVGATILVLFMLNILYVIITNPVAIDYSKSYVGEQSALQGKYIEIVRSMLGIKMLSIEGDVFKQWKERFGKFQTKFYISEKINSLIDVLGATLQLVSPLVVLIIGIHFTIKGNMTLGTTMGLYSISSTYFSFVNNVFNTYWCLVKANIYIDRLGDISSQEKDGMNNELLLKHQARGNITLENVCYSYGDAGKQVLNNISLEINAGEKVAIVGASGCGKSTLAKLIVGLYKPRSGAVRYDGITEEELNIAYLRKQFGIVHQEATLFNKSIYDNIVLDREGITMKDVIEVTKVVNIFDEIDAMPLKFDTIVSDIGANLSGGQMQRIILARTLINNPKILVLDEATSALDNVNETKLSQYLAKKKCTRIIIAHRLSTIMDSDKIAVMDNGFITELGSHDELLKKKKKYYELYNVQREGV